MSSQLLKKQFGLIETHPFDRNLRICRRIEIGKVLQQGDIYMHFVGEDHPHGKEKWGSRQVAVGDTVGARHVATGEVEVFQGTTLPKWVEDRLLAISGFSLDLLKRAILGPVVIAKERWTMDHPEHPNHECPPGRWQITYQLDWATKQRVRD